MTKKKTTLDRFKDFKEAGSTEVPKEEPSKSDIPHGVFIGVVREGRQYKVVELAIGEDSKKSQEWDPTNHGFAVAKAIDRLEELCWKLHNTPWTKEQAAWQKKRGVL